MEANFDFVLEWDFDDFDEAIQSMEDPIHSEDIDLCINSFLSENTSKQVHKIQKSLCRKTL